MSVDFKWIPAAGQVEWGGGHRSFGSSLYATLLLPQVLSVSLPYSLTHSFSIALSLEEFEYKYDIFMFLFSLCG